MVFGEHLARRSERKARHVDRLVARHHGAAEPERLRRRKAVDERQRRIVAQQPRLDFARPHDARRTDEPQRRDVAFDFRTVQRLHEGARERIAYDRRGRYSVTLDRRQRFVGVETARRQRHARSAVRHRGHRRQQPGAVHHRRQRQIHRRRFDLQTLDVSREIRRRRHADARIAASAGASPQVVVAPHHAFRHAGRSAGIQEQHVVAGTVDAERRAAADLRQCLVFARRRRHRHGRPRPPPKAAPSEAARGSPQRVRANSAA